MLSSGVSRLIGAVTRIERTILLEDVSYGCDSQLLVASRAFD